MNCTKYSIYSSSQENTNEATFSCNSVVWSKHGKDFNTIKINQGTLFGDVINSAKPDFHTLLLAPYIVKSVNLHVSANIVAISKKNVPSVNDSMLPHHALAVYVQQHAAKCTTVYIKNPYQSSAEWAWLTCYTGFQCGARFVHNPCNFSDQHWW